MRIGWVRVSGFGGDQCANDEIQRNEYLKHGGEGKKALYGIGQGGQIAVQV